MSVFASTTAYRDVPSDALLSVFHCHGSTFLSALENSPLEIGTLFPELYHLVFKPCLSFAVEEQFLTPRALLLHMYSAVTLIAPRRSAQIKNLRV
jgi:hypothetical protein